MKNQCKKITNTKIYCTLKFQVEEVMFEQHSQFDIFICKHLSFYALSFFTQAQSFLTSMFGKIYSKRSFSSEQKPTGDLWYFILVGRSCAFLQTLSGFIPGHLNQHTHSASLSLTHANTHIHTQFELYFKCSRWSFM